MSHAAAGGSDRPSTARPIYVVRLRPEPSCANPTLALRGLLKVALRRHQLRCVSVTEAHQADDRGDQAPADVPYDAASDISESVRLGFETIRARVRSGGKGWP